MAIDNGCGTGPLCAPIQRLHPNVHMRALYYSPGMIEKV